MSAISYSPAGLNVRGFKVSLQEVLEATDRLGCKYVLIGDNVGLANDVARLRPHVQVIYRSFWPRPDRGDDDLHLYATPDEWIEHMHGLGLHPGIWWHCGNEPTKSWPYLSSWLIEAMRLADSFDRILVVGNFSVGMPPEGAWETALLPLLRAAGDSKHVIGIHEYVYRTLSESGGRLGRFLVGQAVADASRCGKINWLCTEWGWDEAGSYQKLGISGETFADVLNECVQRYYARYKVSLCLFSFGPWAQEPRGEFDIRPILGTLASRVSRIYTENEGTMRRGVLSVQAYSLNIRQGSPSTTAPKGANPFTPGVYPGMIGDEQQVNGYRWVYFEDDLRKGWVAQMCNLVQFRAKVALFSRRQAGGGQAQPAPARRASSEGRTRTANYPGTRFVRSRSGSRQAATLRRTALRDCARSWPRPAPAG